MTRGSRIALFLVVLLAAGLVAAFAAGAFKTTAGLTPGEVAAQRADRAAALLRNAEHADVAATEDVIEVALPTRADPPHLVPSLPADLFTRRLPATEVLGFVPYWEASSITATELADVSTVALFGVEVRKNGSLLESGPGWTYYRTTGFSSVVSAAHADGDRALFTIATTDPTVIAGLTQRPAAASFVLAAALSGAVSIGGLDGVDIDIEGTSQGERSGFVSFVADLVHDLRIDGMRRQIVLDCYPQSAGDSTSFFDVARLAPLVDQVFVMAYDMEQYSISSATAPLASADLGLSDVQSLIQYTKVVPPAKLILGVPFYGVDFTTQSAQAGAETLTPAPSVEFYSTIVAAGRRQYWDPVTDTVWTHFKVGSTWHQTWFDDPLSIALKRALAWHFRLGGVGVWALGEEGAASTDMLSALDGGVAPARVPVG